MNEREENGDDREQGSGPEVRVLRLGKDGPEEVGGVLGEILGQMGSGMIDRAQRDEGPPPLRPATAEVIMTLLAGNTEFAPGDIVKLRDDIGSLANHLKFPKAGDEVIVTDMEYGRRTNDPDAPCNNLEELCIGMQHYCGREGCKIEGMVMEYFFDARLFQKVGNIYNGDKPKPWAPRPLKGPKLFPFPSDSEK